MPSPETPARPPARPPDELRRELHFRRDYDGHVFVRDASGQWWEVRLDAKLPGTMLLRDSNDNVYFITYNNVQQVGSCSSVLYVSELQQW